ncbi:MAG: methionine biosynthesis protein MetW [Cyanobacteria bacterium SIG30]|nr:methionine biosynthesis protein MetW [Cyanobacteria bacterium SIG30]
MSELNYDKITNLVKENSKIIDLGCGDGTLFKKLVEEKNVTGVGVEIRQDAVVKAIEKGLSVIQADLDEGLKEFPDKSFDFAILNRTLQSTEKPDYVIEEMLRVAKKAIVSFPNFAYWKVRFYLFFRGKMPVSEALPWQWYDTPNIHLLTVNDFFDFCKNNNIKILESIYLTNRKSRSNIFIRTITNFFSEEVIFVISK